MDEDTIDTVRNWRKGNEYKNGLLNNLFMVQQFLVFCNYY